MFTTEWTNVSIVVEGIDEMTILPFTFKFNYGQCNHLSQTPLHPVCTNYIKCIKERANCSTIIADNCRWVYIQIWTRTVRVIGLDSLRLEVSQIDLPKCKQTIKRHERTDHYLFSVFTSLTLKWLPRRCTWTLLHYISSKCLSTLHARHLGRLMAYTRL